MASSNRKQKIHPKKGLVQWKNQPNIQMKSSDPKKLSPFEGISHINILRSILHPLIKSHFSSQKSPVTKPNFLDASIVVCRIIFATPVTEMQQVEDCCTLINRFLLTAKEDKTDFILNLEMVFKQKLLERLTFKKRLRDLLKDRQIPWEKKEEWLKRQCEIHGRLLKDTDSRSIKFLNYLHHKIPSLVYNVLQYLLEQQDAEEPLYCFMEALLKTISRDPMLMYDTKNHNEIMEHFQKVKTLGEESHSVPQGIKVLLGQYWNYHFEYKTRQAPQFPAMRVRRL